MPRRDDARRAMGAVAALLWMLSVSAPAHAQDLPTGHPAVDPSSPHSRGAAQGGGMPGVFEPPEDTETPDATLAPGTIAVELRDADDRPVPGVEITLGILINSIAKGDSRRHVQATSSDQGRAIFGGLETASNIAYR